MESITQAAIAASVLIGLMAVPAASKTVDFSEESSSDLSDISGAEDVPEQVSRTASTDSFRASISTAFDEFSAFISPDSANASIENLESSLEVDRSPSETEWVLTTSQGRLTVVESSNAEVEEVSTPRGTLKTETRNGAKTTEFSGSDREEVEKTAHELQQLLEDKKKEVDEKRDRIRKQGLPDIEVVANESTASGFGDNDQEYVVLVNKEFEEVSLDGWVLKDDGGSHELEGVTLGAREELYVYSSAKEDVENPGEPAVFDTGIAWNNGGDTATLKNAEGTEIAEESY